MIIESTLLQQQASQPQIPQASLGSSPAEQILAQHVTATTDTKSRVDADVTSQGNQHLQQGSTFRQVE